MENRKTRYKITETEDAKETDRVDKEKQKERYRKIRRRYSPTTNSMCRTGLRTLPLLCV